MSNIRQILEQDMDKTSCKPASTSNHLLSSGKNMDGPVILQTPLSNAADRIALSKMFKAIAEYGRRVRLRKQAEYETPEQEKPMEPEPDIKRRPVRRKQKRKRKDGAK